MRVPYGGVTSITSVLSVVSSRGICGTTVTTPNRHMTVAKKQGTVTSTVISKTRVPSVGHGSGSIFNTMMKEDQHITVLQTHGTVRSRNNKNILISADHKGKQFGNDIGGVHRGGVTSMKSVLSSGRGHEKTFPVVTKKIKTLLWNLSFV